MRPITTLISAGAATGADVSCLGGEQHLMVEATAWGGATAKLQTVSPLGTYIDVPDASFTENGQVSVKLGRGAVRLHITGDPTAVSAWLKPIHVGG